MTDAPDQTDARSSLFPFTETALAPDFVTRKETP